MVVCVFCMYIVVSEFVRVVDDEVVCCWYFEGCWVLCDVFELVCDCVFGFGFFDCVLDFGVFEDEDDVDYGDYD